MTEKYLLVGFLIVLVIDGGDIGEKHCVIIYDKSSKILHKKCIGNRDQA